ncbi:hypothetical protein MTR_4g127740 [Medicago truncatula]|uniref:Uncharacterized protein n=1 Tax=Medicago truncatula TaxID=3880 RepID=G7JUD4_MEDTR|nr:hypothetical protein MTR_4g127740 [Medicago truncatula]
MHQPFTAIIHNKLIVTSGPTVQIQSHRTEPDSTTNTATKNIVVVFVDKPNQENCRSQHTWKNQKSTGSASTPRHVHDGIETNPTVSTKAFPNQLKSGTA